MQQFNIMRIERNEEESYDVLPQLQGERISYSFQDFSKENSKYFLTTGDFPAICSFDEESGAAKLIAKFYYETKNFLYGEHIPTGKCLYGILGSPLYRKVQRSELTIFGSKCNFEDLGKNKAIPEYSCFVSDWREAFRIKNFMILQH